MDEFLFGILSTTEKRAAYAGAQRRGLQHHHQLTPRAPSPEDRPVLTATVELDQAVERVLYVQLEPEPAVLPLHPVHIDWDLFNWAYYQTWQVTLLPQPAGTLVRYRIEAHLRDGGDPILADDGAVFSYLVGDPSPPAWTAAAIVYQIFPDRFYPGDGRRWNQTQSLNDIYGGSLPGLLDKLDYIADLGFNCLWLNPFFPDRTHHGYHATDYFAVNPRLGTLDDVRQLVDEAHTRGMRLLLDFVANHWGSRHPTFQEATADPGSPYRDWYHWQEWPHAYETFFNVQDLPKVNVDHPAARDYLLRSARFWLAEIGFDGLRLDYVLGPSHDFWTELRAVVKGIKPDAWLFGEAVETPAVQLSYEGRFDGCLDFLLAQALRQTFALGNRSLAAFDSFLHLHEAFFPAHFGRPSFLDNHDMNRFLWLAGGDKRKLKLAALCQFTLAGPPIVYQGTEVGLSQARGIAQPGSQGMAECRQPMVWGQAQDQDLHAYYKWLIHLRRRRPILGHGRRRTVHLDSAAGTYAYLRFDQNESILVAFNLSGEERVISPENVSADGTGLSLTLPPWQGHLSVLD